MGLVKNVTSGRYLKRADPVEWPKVFLGQEETVNALWPVIPVLVNLHAFRTTAFTMELEALNADLSVQRSYWRQNLDPEQMLNAVMEGTKWETGPGGQLLTTDALVGKGGPIRYQSTTSPYPERWPAAVAIEPQAADVSHAKGDEHRRTLTWDGRDQATRQAYEQRTGESWAILNQGFKDWVRQ